MKLSIQEQINPDEGYMVFVPANFVQLLSGILVELSQPWIWQSRADYATAYHVIARLRGCMLDCPAERLLHGVENVVRHIDTIHNGTVYTVISEEPLVIEPPLPVVPNTIAALPGEKAQLEEVNVKLQAILDNMAADDEDLDAILSAVQVIGGLLA